MTRPSATLLEERSSLRSRSPDALSGGRRKQKRSRRAGTQETIVALETRPSTTGVPSAQDGDNLKPSVQDGELRNTYHGTLLALEIRPSTTGVPSAQDGDNLKPSVQDGGLRNTYHGTLLALEIRPSTAGRRTRPSAHVSRCSFGRTAIANYQLPITNYQLPITNYHLLITNYLHP